MTIIQRINQKILEKIYLSILNLIYIIKYKKISISKTTTNNSKIKFSIILPTYNSNPIHLINCIQSVINQTYPNWELCISDDASNQQDTLKTLKKYIKNTKIKIIYNKINKGISINTNKAASLATGDYFCLLDHDDLLWPNALNEIANILENKPNTKFIYTDEDKILKNQHKQPFLKPDFDYNIIKSVNYFNHLTVIKKSIFYQLKGFKTGIEGAQDWDLYLRMLKIVKPTEIYHLNKILYSWRISPTSTSGNIAKSYAYTNQENVLKNNFSNDKINKTPYLGIWQLNEQKYPLPYQFYLKSLINLLSL